MKKLPILAGLVLAAIFMFKVGSGEFATVDVLRMMQDDDDLVNQLLGYVEENFSTTGEVEVTPPERKVEHYFEIGESDVSYYEDASEKIWRDGAYSSPVRGAVLSPERLTEMAEFLARLEATQEVETFVMLEDNHYMRVRNAMAAPGYGYRTVFGDIDPDFELIEDLLESDSLDFGSTYRPFSPGYEQNDIIPLIVKTFPEAKFVQIGIKDFAGNGEIEAFSEKLSELSDGAVVIALTSFSQNMTERTAMFHDELSRTVLDTVDAGGVEQLDIDSKNVLYAALSYFEALGAEKAVIHKHSIEDGISHLGVTYHDGESLGDRNLTIMAFGDVMLGRFVRTLMDRNGKDYIFEKIKGFEGRFFEGADVIHANLEGPIKGLGKSGGTAMNFSFNEDVAPFLKENGFNLMSIANNHAVDQGWEGRETTIEALDSSGIGWCGHPSEPEASSVYYGKVDDKDFAFICLQDVTFKLDDAAALELIREVREKVDYLLVSIHWGIEYRHQPDLNLQVNPAHAFIDAGADFVIGHHPHVVESFEVYNGRMIFYSLGNFVFDQYWSGETQEELAIGIMLDDQPDGGMRTKVYLYPMKSVMSQSQLLNQEEYDKWIEEFIGYADYDEAMKRQIRDGVIEVRD